MGALLSDLTLFTTFLCLGYTLWFAIYLLSRSRNNPIAFRAITALVALAIYYVYLLNAIVTRTNEKNAVRLFSVTVALIACHDLTHYMLSQQQRRKLYPLARAVLLGGVIIIILIFTAPRPQLCDPSIICPTDMSYPYQIIETYNGMIFCSILYNLWMIRRTEGLVTNLAFYLAVLIGIGAVTFSFIGTVLDMAMPRLLPNLLILAALVLLSYSVARDRTLVTRWATPYDLPVTLLTIVVIVMLYILTAQQLNLSGIDLFIIAILAVFTHSAYDLVRELLDRLFHRQQRKILRELDTLGRDVSTSESFQRYLGRGLAILCKNLNTLCGFIAVREGGQYTVVVSFHSLHVGETLPAKEATLDGYTPSNSIIFPNIAWLAPGYAGSEQMVVIGIGQRKDKIPYDEEDLNWLEDVAHEIGQIVLFHQQLKPSPAQEVLLEVAMSEPGTARALNQGDLFSALAYKPDLELVKSIEDGYQHLNDYAELGKSPLVEQFGVIGSDHLESGKIVHNKLIQILEKLRPAGELPHEPLPREWYAYTILHDSYVSNCLSRDIMGKLYIGEGTYYRIRRQALRSISRVVQEMQAVAGHYEVE